MTITSLIMPANHHTFYAAVTKDHLLRGEFKGGECENEYTRLRQYGTYASGSDPYRFEFLVHVSILSKKTIHSIEKNWLSRFENVSSVSEDINSASGTEFRKFSDPKELLEKFLETLKDFNMAGSLIKAYTTADEIRECLKNSRNVMIPSAPPRSTSGLTLRPYQSEDVQSTFFAFTQEGVRRGWWAIECGLGKTVMAFELIGRMNLRINFFVVPRTALLEQSLREFKKWYPKDRLFACCGSSLPEDLRDIQRVSGADDLPTDDKQFILVVTYDSLAKFKDYHVNLSISDEGHHLVPSGKKENKNGNVFGLYDENIRVDYRLAITSTPKDTPIIDDGNIQYLGMSHQPELYGSCLAERNYIFGRDNGYLSPFEVICMKTNPREIRQQIAGLKTLFNLHRDTFQGFLEGLEEWESGKSRDMSEFIDKDGSDDSPITEDIILWYALIAVQLVQMITKFSVRRIITYHTTISRAHKFSEILNKILLCMNKTHLTYSCDSVCSKQSNGINQATKASFLAEKGADIRILTNCRTLIEGFDAPSVDCTVFADNKYSPIECCQIVGRGNRKDSNNSTKRHYVCIPFIAYEKEDRDSIILRSTNDYKTVRYVVKNIIPSSDTAKTISQTVWVPPSITGDREDIAHDKTERVWVSSEENDLHDSSIAASISTTDIAGESFASARQWMHDKARAEGWVAKCKAETDIRSAWQRYCQRHVLPKGIPCDPSKVFKEVGWINWRDYCGILIRRDEMREISSGEFQRLVECFGHRIIGMTMSELHTFVEHTITRRLPGNPRMKWKRGIYDVIGAVKPELVASIKKLGKFPDGIFVILKGEGVRGTVDFERLWPELKDRHTNIPAIPTDIWGDTFWAKFDEFLND
jgi:superfamily II DNA or RNA helicase